MFINNLIAGSAGQATDFYPTTIEQSLRFNDNDSAYLSRTFAAGDQKTWTWSGWVKIGNISANSTIFSGGSSTGRVALYKSSGGNLITDLGGTGAYDQSVAVFRDPSAWYHLVWRFNTLDGTGANRSRIWINGEEITLTKTRTWSFDTNYAINSAALHTMGVFSNSIGTYHLDGYLAEVHFTDGTAYDADAFGEFKENVWVAKTPSVTYGTNGFHLEFDGNVNDSSGEGNNWTANNITSDDYVSDSPTNNFATLNPLTGGSSTTSNGNLEATIAPVNGARVSTFAVNSGKWYCEMVPTTIAGYFVVGIGAPYSKGWNSSQEANPKTIVYTSQGNLTSNGGWSTSSSTVSGTYTTNDVIGIALDMESATNTIEFYKNGTSVGSANITVDSDVSFLIGNSSGASNGAGRVNFGQQDFTYTPPTDYLALSTANLPDPEIDPAQGSSPVDYFGTLTWSGDDNATRTIQAGGSGVTGDINFTPDFSWVKRRNGSSNGSDHMLLDAVRGVGSFNALVSNGPSPDGTRAEGKTQAGSAWTNFGDINAYTTDGFTVQKGSDPSHTLEGINQSGGTYVGWLWNLGGAPTVDNSAGAGATPTAGSVKVNGSNYGSALAGSIPATRLSANTTSGCSIVTYTGTGSDGTIAHGLSQAPEMLVFRRRDADGTDHLVYHSALGAGKNLRHNNTDAENSNTTFFQNTAPTSTVFSIGSSTLNTNGRTFVVYCFHSVEGFSKFGSFSGNNSTDGPFIYLGFRPALFMVKCKNTTGSWYCYDTTRLDYNVMGSQGQPIAWDTTAGEDSGADASWYVDALSNGIKIRNNSNFDNGTNSFIYMAFAENPFKYSNAR